MKRFLVTIVLTLLCTVSVYAEPLFVGDSRTVGMSNVVSINKIAKTGSTYYWLVNQKIPIPTERNTPIIFGHGVNDPLNVDKYIEYYKKNIPILVSEGYNVYLLSVNPILSNYQGSVKQTDIDKFNKRLKEEFPDNYIDTTNCTKFKANDGLHYNRQNYKELYDYIMEEIQNAAKTKDVHSNYYTTEHTIYRMSNGGGTDLHKHLHKTSNSTQRRTR